MFPQSGAWLDQDEPGWWCRDNATMCPEVWWCNVSGILLSTLAGVCLWIVLFALLAAVLQPVNTAIHDKWPSKVEDEQQVSWLVLHIQSTIHASLVVWMVFMPIWQLTTADPSAQFDAPNAAFLDHRKAIADIANASHVFFCYTIVDTFVAFWRRSMTIDYFCHHMVFIFFCLMIQYDCFAPYLAGWLIVMEISTIFLNGFTYWRNRLGYDHAIVRAFFVVFGLTFFTFRLAGTSYVAYAWVLAVFGSDVAFDGIPRWHLFVLSGALVGAVALQFFWARSIMKKLLKVFDKPKDKDHTLVPSSEEGEASTDED